MRARSIQFRLTVWYALVLAAALGLFGILIWFSMRERLVNDADSELRASASRFEKYFRREAAQESGRHLVAEMEEFCQALPASTYIELRGAAGFEFHFPEKPRNGRRNVRSVHRNFTLAGDSFALEVDASSREIWHTLELLRFLLLSLIPVVIGLACLGGAWLSRRALRPVDEITTTAKTIGIENLSLRLPVPRTGDELERLTEVWNTMLARLEGAVGTLSQFAADASHELRTPLAVIRTSAELALRRARSAESYRESLAGIAAESERMTQLVEDLLFLARGDAHSAAMPVSAVDLSELLRQVTNELGDLAKLRYIEVSFTQSGEPVSVTGNPAALRRLFLVLLDNALKYSHEGGNVHVTMAAVAGHVTVAVRDFGPGIGAEDLPQIFRRFYRADKARGDGGHGGGHGLGLSLADSIARAHGVRIEVSSLEGEGALFSVRFPALLYDKIAV